MRDEPLGLMVGPFGAAFAYEVFANGQRIAMLGNFDTLGMRLPTAQVFPLPQQPGRR